MREVRVTRTERDGAVEIEFRFKSADQLLNPNDPSPPSPPPGSSRSLVRSTSPVISTGATSRRSPPSPSAFRGRRSPPGGEAALLPETIRRHFSFRIADLDDDRRVSRREGKISVILAGINACIAILFLLVFVGRLDDPPPWFCSPASSPS
ncbi:hypothetical protein [Methanoculleus chikugoensis]|uniref:hypothetical protein n=1 Tax=Methanoculleus chikugoensis TaxID=118126 RepID=UPI0006D03239|nr:hypothetical protein [Methanoculleus chikugoensis]